MKVKMLKPTYWDSKRLKAGDTANVDPFVAERWDRNGIAKITEEKATGEKPLDKMTTKELTQRGAVLGIDISGANTNKQRADVIQAFLDNAASDQKPGDSGGEE